ncbi:MAG TPA: LuxR C-terminal-related transcriptional regulator [Chloroflexota bacterium]|nr:LuxR C-terminal-related transcriptional regulator [Chloroflexota bacterium]
MLGLRADPSRVHNLGYVALAAGQTGTAAARFAEALRAFRRVGDQRGVAECLIGLGCVRAAQRRSADAAELFGAGEALLEALGSAIWASNRADYGHWTRIARAGVDADAWLTAWTAGRTLEVESVVEAEILASVRTLAAAAPGTQHGSGLGLTAREREVAGLAAQGLSNRAIAERLVIAEKTAANHLQNALDKLDVHSHAQLAARAAELGLTASA